MTVAPACPSVPADAASCPSSLSVSRKRKVWLSSRAKSACRTPMSLSRAMRLSVAVSSKPCSMRETANAVNDRKDATLLEVQRVALALGRDQIVEQPDRCRKGVHGTREMSQVDLLATDQIDQCCLGRRSATARRRQRRAHRRRLPRSCARLRRATPPSGGNPAR